MKNLLKNFHLSVLAALIISAALIFTCGDHEYMGGPKEWKDDEPPSQATPLDFVIIPPTTDVSTPSFVIIFPFGADDADVDFKTRFTMAKTEMTYKVWQEVVAWATTRKNTDPSHADYSKRAADGGEVYTFKNIGTRGSDYTPYTGQETQPVTEVSYCDALAFANAFTEWYNVKESKTYTLVYKIGTSDYKNATQDCSGVLQTAGNTGFRLPTHQEWEFAARYQGKTPIPNTIGAGLESWQKVTAIKGIFYFSIAQSASGAAGFKAAEGGCCSGGPGPIDPYAWYGNNSGKYTHKVATTHDKGKNKVADVNANRLGLYDITGNVSEWVFGVAPEPCTAEQRGTRGADYNNMWGPTAISNVSQCQLPTNTAITIGFRLVRSL